MAEVNWALPREVPTPSEAEFMEVLEGLIPRTLDFDFWEDSDNGAPWMMVHLGLLGGGGCWDSRSGATRTDEK
jgi:hypothetical protein